MRKRIKIFVDACMLVILFLLFPTARVSAPLHIFLGFALVAVIIIHLLLNGKWLLTSIKNLFCGKLNPKARYMLMLVIGLIIAFSICTYSGVAVYLSDYYSTTHRYRGVIDPSIRFLYRLHGMSAVACIILTFLHAKVHWGYIKTFFHRKKQKPISKVQQ